VQVVVPAQQPPFLLRVIWFLVVGWWASGVAIVVAYALMLTIVLIPLGIWVLHRVPQIQTLRDRTREFETLYSGDGSTQIRQTVIAQRPVLIRAIWFVLVGFWLTAIWLSVAWLLSVLILTLPISIIMIDRAPGILTLQRH
jgi:uncharacterized membrane protein YccF (DUF307 family)